MSEKRPRGRPRSEKSARQRNTEKVRRYRAKRKPQAHQRIIREKLAKTDPRPVPPSLVGYHVAQISRAEAEPLILAYEWLHSMGSATRFVGLLSPEGELHGVAAFGYGPQGPIRKRIGEPALCLERGCCIHFAPRNSASFLINRACKLICRHEGTAIFFAYADPGAGEYGAVYQAAGWAYLGQGLDGHGSRTALLPPGGDPNDPGQWRSGQALRHYKPPLTRPEALALGWQVVLRQAKHIYAHNVGPDHQEWRAGVRRQSYPAPQPALKLANQVRPGAPV